jgi:N-acyl-D-aspartate/D-glutamate deacylase
MDVGIDLSGRLVVDSGRTLEGQEIIHIENRIVSSGFIDILSDNTSNPLQTYSIFERYKVSDGVTTACLLQNLRRKTTPHQLRRLDSRHEGTICDC